MSGEQEYSAADQSSSVKHLLNRGEPAFPLATIDGYTQYGATLRDWFAAHASESDLKAQINAILYGGGGGLSPLPCLPDNWTAIARYMHADSMLKARQS